MIKRPEKIIMKLSRNYYSYLDIMDYMLVIIKRNYILTEEEISNIKQDIEENSKIIKMMDNGELISGIQYIESDSHYEKRCERLFKINDLNMFI